MEKETIEKQKNLVSSVWFFTVLGHQLSIIHN